MAAATSTAAGAGPVSAGPPPGGTAWPGDSRHFWGIYSLAWIPYAAGYLVLAFTSDCTSLAKAATYGVLFAVPGAALGVGPVQLTRRWDWPPERPARFAGIHLGLALLYTVLWLGTVDLLLAVVRVLQGGPFRLAGLDASLFRWHFVAGLLLYGTLVAVTYLARTGRRLRAERERAARSEALRVRARIEAMESRLSPHFLFNALHSSLSLIRRAPERAETAIERLGDLLRYAVDGPDRDGREEVTLAREMEMVEAYLEVEELRLGDRLRVASSVTEEAREARLPPLTIQPLVENAVQHGVSASEEGGTVHVRAWREGDSLRITVRDDGPGASPEDVRSSDGSGLELVEKRLELLYGEDASVEVATSPDEGFEVRVRIPVEPDAGAVSAGSSGRDAE